VIGALLALLALALLLAAVVPLLGRATVEPADDEATGGDCGYFGG
jgi:hypothetical protein